MNRPSTYPSVTHIRLKRFMAVALMAATLGACMSSPGTGKNDPLPVKSRQEALDWARQLMAHLAQTAGIEINSEPEQITFSPCIGRNGESAPDDRYTLLYFAHSDVPAARQNDVVRSVRDLLTNEGLRISSYHETPATQPNSTVTARHPDSRYVTTVFSTDDTRMALSVNTPCLLPPTASASPTP
ncbi:hypothetical protein OG535_08225 [Kitasatospora sp. NBC_00085]|uniref:hypothetical protein n=1 Tax=Kitasatospora sp. NBC_00085 TaxID=2903566 RepID=UPI003254E562